MGGGAGIPLMEVFNITYLGNEELDAEDQLGTIIAMSSASFQYLYDVTKFDITMPSIKLGDLIFMTSSKPILYYPNLILQFDLFSGLFKDTIHIDWDSRIFNDVTSHSKRISAFDGSGDIVFNYGLFTNAAVAHISVKLFDLEVPFAAVHGLIVASNTKCLDRPSCLSMLFVRDADNEVYAEFDQTIPLSRSCVAVPLDSTLGVHISLKYDDEDYNAELFFDAQTKGTVVHDSGLIQVMVTWSADVHSIIASCEARRC